MITDIKGVELKVGQRVVVAGRKWHYSSRIALRRGVVSNIVEGEGYSHSKITIQYYYNDWETEFTKQTLSKWSGELSEMICVIN